MLHSPHSYVPKCGDHYFQRKRSLVSRGIAWFTRGRNEDKTLATHEGVYIGAGLLVEAHWPRVRISNFKAVTEALLRSGGEYAIYTRAGDVTADECREIVRQARMMNGWGYSVSEIALQSIDGAIGKLIRRDVNWFRRLGEVVSDRVICSRLAAKIYLAVGWDSKLALTRNPDESHDQRFRDMEWIPAEYSDGWFFPKRTKVHYEDV